MGGPNLLEGQTRPAQSSAREWKRAVLGLVAIALLHSFLAGSLGSSYVGDARDACLRAVALKEPPTNEERAMRLLHDSPLIDGHNDLMIKIREHYHNLINGDNFTRKWEQGGLEGEVDLPRMKQGLYSGAFWAAWYLCPSDVFDFSAPAYDPIVRATLSQIDLYHRLAARYPLTFPATPDAATARKNSKAGKRIAILAIEGLHQIGGVFSNLRLYFQLGVRYATLNWNCHNAFADAAVLTFRDNFTSVASSPYWGGISRKGRLVIGEMNRLGMIVDLSHTSRDTMIDVLNGTHSFGPHSDIAPGDQQWTGSVAPPIFSHSSAYSICPHPRNVPDHVLQMVKARNTLVMVNVNPEFISCRAPSDDAPSGALPVFDEEHSTIDQIVKHILHIGRLIGFDHVGLGTDFDGIENTPRGFEDASAMPALVVKLLEAGVSDEDIGKFLGKNLLRVWNEVDKVAAQMKRDGVAAVEDELEELLP